MKRLRTYLVTGLLVWVPLGITFFVLNVLVGIVDRTLLLLPPLLAPTAMSRPLRSFARGPMALRSLTSRNSGCGVSTFWTQLSAVTS